MATASDNFNRSENPLSTGWTDAGGTIAANGTHAVGSAGSNTFYYSGTSFGAEQYSEITIGTYASGKMGPVLRHNGTDRYLLYLHSNDGWQLFKGGFSTQAQGTFTAAIVTNDVVRIQATGTATTVFDILVNGVSQAAGVFSGSLTDASSPITSGQPGIWLEDTTATINGWGGGDLAGAAYSLVLDAGSYAVTGADTTLSVQAVQTWFRVSK